MPYPAGIADIPKDDWININEAGVFLETANRKAGKGYIEVMIREEDPHDHSEKYTLTMFIS